jgi:prepilin-type N-terminal cleavage/methylation domain-containing protein
VNRLRREDGFSLVELLVVVLIIAILAAISTASFIAQREKAYISDVQSTLRNAAASAEGIATQNEGSYSTVTPATLDSEGLRTSGGQTVDVPVATTTAYCIEVEDDRLSGHPSWATGRFDSANGRPEPGTC